MIKILLNYLFAGFFVFLSMSAGFFIMNGFHFMHLFDEPIFAITFFVLPFTIGTFFNTSAGDLWSRIS